MYHKNSVSRSFLRRVFLRGALTTITLACFTSAGRSQAADGGLPGNNTAEGDFALNSNGGSDNTALGYSALFSTTGRFNTATGSSALFNNTTGEFNTATGYHALVSNTEGNFDTATGTYALELNTTGYANTANGYRALAGNTTGNTNTASGFAALHYNTDGSLNTAMGYNALYVNSSGNNNTAYGNYSLFNNNTGSNNIGLGANAGANLTSGNNNIDIGNLGVAGESAKIRIGTKGTQNGTFIAGISGVAVTGVQVVVNSNGKLGIAGSSARYKQAIKPMNEASEAIFELEPVTFRYKEDLDPDAIPQFGLVAEQVEKVDPNLVARDADGEVNTVRYEAVDAMLLNEFLKEHRRVQSLQTMVAQQRTEMEILTRTVKEQSSEIRKVNEKLELSSQGTPVVTSGR